MKVAHQIPGRIRINVGSAISPQQLRLLVDDLRASPDVSHVSIRGKNLIVEHSTDKQSMTVVGQAVDKALPGFDRWSNDVDVAMAKYAAEPWINKSLPLGFLALAIFRGLSEGAFLAGESAFALAYVGFDLYWKFQQENVVKKIEQGMSRDEKSAVQN